MNCSSCGKKLDSIKVNIRLSFSVDRLNENGTWENIPNSVGSPMETLCEECFDSFAEVIGERFNKEDV